jgi:hypothetical protein
VALRRKSDEGGYALDRCMSIAERGGRGAGELWCRTQPQNGRERRMALTAFDRMKKGNGEGSDAGGATRRMEEGRGPGSIAPHGGGRRGGPGSRQGARPVEVVAGLASTC